MAEFGDLHILYLSSLLVKPNSHPLLQPRVLSLGLSLQIHLCFPEKREKTESFYEVGLIHTFIEQQAILPIWKHLIGALQSGPKVYILPFQHLGMGIRFVYAQPVNIRG